MFSDFSHVNIRTADMEGSKRLFVDVLGLTEGWRPDIPYPGAWLYWKDQALVHLAQLDEAAAPSSHTSLDHFGLYIEDYEETRARLDACGIAYEEGGRPDLGLFLLTVCDASGVTVELTKRGKPRA